MLDWVGRKLIAILPSLFFLTGILVLVRAGQVILHRELTYPFVLSVAALGGVTAYLLINAVVHVTSFPLTAVSTFSPIYPLLLIFMVTVIWDVGTAWLSAKEKTA